MMFPDLPMNEDDLVGIPPETGEQMLTVTLLKQYSFCPRIAYYETCLPGIRPTTYSMRAGKAAHEHEQQRAARRSLAAYHLPVGERRFNVRMSSAQLGLSGLVDELVITPDELIVVDYKLAEWSGDNNLIQVGAYSLLAEEVFGRPVRRAFLYLIKAKRFEEVPIDAALRNSVITILHDVQRIRLYERMPPPVELKSKCLSCEFRRFCNDV